MPALAAASPSLVLEVGDQPLSISRLTDPRTPTTYGRDLRQDVLVRFPDRVSDPVFLRTSSVRAEGDGIAISLSDDSEHVSGLLVVRPSEVGLRFALRIESATPIWMVEWKMEGLDLDELVIPALGGQAVSRHMPVGRELAFKYPFWWNAQFALGCREQGGGLFLYTRDVDAGLRLLRIRRHRERQGFSMGLGFEARAPLLATDLDAEWSLEAFSGVWTEPVDRHRDWLRKAYGLSSAEAHPHAPAWVRDIDLVFEIWGMRKDVGRPAHTFDEMIERIETLSGMFPPDRTLLYLPGFAEQGIDANAPSYEPSAQLGGRDGLRRLVKRAHALGYRVMLHTNVLAMAFSHPRFAEFRRFQVVDPFGRPQAWGLDLDGDWLHEPYFAYINPAAEKWTALMTGVIGDLIHTYGVDAIFLDQTLLAFNDSRGRDFVTGMREHVRRLQTAFPNVLFGGEGLHERVLPVLPFVQIHGLDSVANVHGLEDQAPWRRVHPVSVRLFGPFTSFVAHLLTAHPDSEAFARQQAAYEALGVVPALVLWDRSQGLESPGVRRLLAAARQRRSAEPAR